MFSAICLIAGKEVYAKLLSSSHSDNKSLVVQYGNNIYLRICDVMYHIHLSHTCSVARGLLAWLKQTWPVLPKNQLIHSLVFPNRVVATWYGYLVIARHTCSWILVVSLWLVNLSSLFLHVLARGSLSIFIHSVDITFKQNSEKHLYAMRTVIIWHVILLWHDVLRQ